MYESKLIVYWLPLRKARSWFAYSDGIQYDFAALNP